MDNQHKLIKGYRDLTQEEINLINTFKEEEAAALRKLDTYSRYDPNEGGIELNQRSLALARTKFQEAYMWLIRAVARPNGE